MKEDNCGFKYPFVNHDVCIECGLCLKVCPELNEPALNAPKQVYALSNKDKGIQTTTSSAGFSTVLSTKIVNEGGIVYGCCQENFEIVGHIRIDNIADLNLIKNSKYVHSDIRDSYRNAKKDLDKRRTVLFTGTPCQIAGLLCYLRKSYSNLITLDVVCHGVPPMKMLKEQVRSYSETKNIPAEDIRVSYRWKQQHRFKPIDIKFGLRTEVRRNGKFKIVKEENDNVNPYMRCFQTGISLRENCLNCHYAQEKRVSDLTAADFWGIGHEVSSSMIDNYGVTLLLINTDRGLSLFEQIQKNFDIETHTLNEAKIRNRCLTQPFPRLKERDRFLELYEKEGLYAATFATDPVYRYESRPIIRLMRSTKYTNLALRAVNKLLRITKGLYEKK